MMVSPAWKSAADLAAQTLRAVYEASRQHALGQKLKDWVKTQDKKTLSLLGAGATVIVGSGLFVSKLSAMGFLAGAGGIVLYDSLKSAKRPEELGVQGGIAAISAVAGLAAGFLLSIGPAILSAFGSDISVSKVAVAAWATCSTFGTLAGLWYLRRGIRYVEQWKNAHTVRSALERNKKTDVRNIDEFLPQAGKPYDPRQYFDFTKGIFIGLDEHDEPVYVDKETWETSHILLSGRTRSGKGVAAQILLSQAIKLGELVVILDPKRDNFMPHIFKEACEESNRPYHYLDLTSDVPQIDMFADCDEETIENMLIAAFSLSEKGEAADFYRLKDRKAARDTARFVAKARMTPRDVAKNLIGTTASDVFAQLGDAWIEEAAGYHAALREMAEMPAVNRKDGKGIDIKAMLETGGCLYVVGDMSNSRVLRMQRMILCKMMMIAKKRDDLNGQPRIIRILADEFKAHISRPFMTSLGASAGWRLLSILAFQSLQDLADCPGDLDKEVVKGGVMENCAIQLSYAIKDPDTAEWLARSTGTILVDTERRVLKKNAALAETMEDDRTISQDERYFVDENMIRNLKKGCGVLSTGQGLARFCKTSFIPAKRTVAAISPTVEPEVLEGAQKSADVLSLAELPDLPTIAPVVAVGAASIAAVAQTADMGLELAQEVVLPEVPSIPELPDLPEIPSLEDYV